MLPIKERGLYVASLSQCPIPAIHADFPGFGFKIVEHSRYLLVIPHLQT